jgi:hypothetical protein
MYLNLRREVVQIDLSRARLSAGEDGTGAAIEQHPPSWTPFCRVVEGNARLGRVSKGCELSKELRARKSRARVRHRTPIGWAKMCTEILKLIEYLYSTNLLRNCITRHLPFAVSLKIERILGCCAYSSEKSKMKASIAFPSTQFSSLHPGQSIHTNNRWPREEDRLHGSTLAKCLSPVISTQTPSPSPKTTQRRTSFLSRMFGLQNHITEVTGNAPAVSNSRRWSWLALMLF